MPTYRAGVANDRLLSTGEAARALGLSTRSLARWAKEGMVTPALVTPGGQYRWNLDDLRRQLRESRARSES
ncbi:helix-turn-helix domain-containing protein [Pseudonocardia sp. CA-107938]|uniref:helix-turn-helix domain-containing protein n=1 Tax=Pseudonocardia sp. CA-107938 TaxID=3240021 RepID=UPI003D8B5D7A